ncbi:LytTR family DNA-binding domain-containing protein [Oscillibacter sp.]|uniref:LytR/AlgR family response regulator transcription factor n=1 Tax=Oscillibacter sp. TaxID=1945593 RepID=UPI0028B0EEE0|nr:LytTR family DNA-binding domain-containing protein [Oscillibacter sp.]
MISIAICDDELQQLERTKDLLKNYAFEHSQYDIKIHSFAAPLELLSFVSANGGFDLLLLDVYMDGILGTDAARELRDMGDTCQIIFLTTSRDHAIDAFSLGATHYLVKPYSEKEFFSALDKVVDKLTKKDEAYITIKSTDGISRVDLNKLVYSETNNHVQKLYLSDGRVINVRKASTELFESLQDEPRFYKCGSTYIINMDYIVELSSKGVAFSSGARIPILSRKYMELKKRYMDYSCRI